MSWIRPGRFEMDTTMQGTNQPGIAARKGMAYVPALLFISLFTSLSVAMYTTANLNLRIADNYSKVQSARFAAESGMSWILYRLGTVELPANTTQSTLLDNLYTELSDAGLSVTRTTGGVVVSEMTLPSGSFVGAFALPSPPAGNNLRLIVGGVCQGMTRNVAVTLNTAAHRSRIFDFGVGSKGMISITGNATVTGMNAPGEGNILSTKPELVAIEAFGNATIGGDLHLASASEASVDFTGKSISVAGETDLDIILAEHVHLETDAPAFPAVDVSPFQALATGMVINSSTDIAGTSQLTNAVIEPNTNPHFSSNTTINGVLYIKSPNTVIFSGSATIKGIIVTDDPASPDMAANQISFRGNISAPGVGALSNSSEFAVVKQYTGTVLLAPGYNVDFRGGTTSINGVIAADQLSFRGSPNVAGELTGSIIGLKDLPMTLQGNTTIRINRETMDPMPAGFVHPLGVTAVPSSYVENTDGT